MQKPDLSALELLSRQLANASSAYEKNTLLSSHPSVLSYLEKAGPVRTFLAGLSPECEVAFKQVIAIGQADLLMQVESTDGASAEKLRHLLQHLLSIDHFYREIGGIVGYQSTILRLLQEKEEEKASEEAHYHAPHFLEISQENEQVVDLIQAGLEGLPFLAEMYPLGGAADRLHLVDEQTGSELPAAKLRFAGRTLLEGLVRDLQAREHLYYQIYGKQLTTPIAIMTSWEKDNHQHVLQICEEHRWFGRPKESFAFFTQPLVPAVNQEGNWCVVAPLKPLLKPGGHGVIWKLARDQGVFDWFQAQGRTKALIRQINNPLAGLDYGLLAFTGFGFQKEMLFGFASCPRLLQAAEGVNVLIERKSEKKRTVRLSNIEYCDFAKFGIEDRPLKEGEPYSRFSSNTNILFADLQAISQAVDTCPFPGLLINLKQATYWTEQGEKKEEALARLESTMQNIADVFEEEKEEFSPLFTEKTFVTYNSRHKTISTAKKAYVPGKTLPETPENCFYDLLSAHRELLQAYCRFTLPPSQGVTEYLEKGPAFLFLYHPALGPLYTEIAKKISGGSLALGSELLLEIADLQMQQVHVAGSLQIVAEQVMGSWDEKGCLRYGSEKGSCHLKDVRIENAGVDWAASSPFWKMQLKRKETVQIILKGRSRFTAEGVTFKGSHLFVVEEGMHLHVTETKEGLILEKKPL